MEYDEMEWKEGGSKDLQRKKGTEKGFVYNRSWFEVMWESEIQICVQLKQYNVSFELG